MRRGGDRFMQLSNAEINEIVGDYRSYGIVQQDQSVTPVDDTRRIRLLAFVDAEFFSPYTVRAGSRYRVFTGRSAVVCRQHPLPTRLPGAYRYLALHLVYCGWPLRGLV